MLVRAPEELQAPVFEAGIPVTARPETEPSSARSHDPAVTLVRAWPGDMCGSLHRSDSGPPFVILLRITLAMAGPLRSYRAMSSATFLVGHNVKLQMDL